MIDSESPWCPGRREPSRARTQGAFRVVNLWARPRTQPASRRLAGLGSDLRSTQIADGDGSQPQPRHLTPTTTHLRPGARGYGINHLGGQVGATGLEPVTFRA